MSNKNKKELGIIFEYFDDVIYVGFYDKLTLEMKASFSIDYNDFAEFKKWFYEENKNNPITIHIPKRCSCSPDIFIELNKKGDKIIINYKTTENESKEEQYFINKNTFEKIFKEKYNYGEF